MRDRPKHRIELARAIFNHLVNFSRTDSKRLRRLLEATTSAAVLPVALTADHVYAGSRTDSRGWILMSRIVTPVLFLISPATFCPAVRMTEG